MDIVVNVLEFIFKIIVPLIPLFIKGLQILGQAIHNTRLVNLTSRAAIIVTALEQLDLTNEQKRDVAIAKLMSYADEVKIPLTEEQALDYVESSVYSNKNKV